MFKKKIDLKIYCVYKSYSYTMTDSIIDGTQINTNVFSYSAPKAHASGGKVVNLYNKNTRESLTISTPLLLTWGAQEGKDQQKNPTGKFTMSLQFPNSEYPNADGEAFLTSMRALEAKVKADAMTYSKDWFGKAITSADVMDEKFNVMLRHPKITGTQEPDVSKAPTLTVKIPCWSGSWKSEIYDEEGEPLYVNGKTNSHLSPLEFVKPKTHVICLIQCGGLWFVNGKVSITWNLKQAIVQKPKNSMEGQCLLKPKAADKEKLKTMELPVEAIVDPDGGVSAMVEDSDDEEEEIEVVRKPEPVVVPEPEPVKPEAPVAVAEEPKKKRVITKKKVEA
jgi:hypothetical protein